ncbi:hypothetical protein, partial [Mucilaginibacter endophyticus]|uniref:hypothetical protein n=1 Tax=Mucilaginibacter endophyticus TaxID=2675003 RepID=UPI001ABF3845
MEIKIANYLRLLPLVAIREGSDFHREGKKLTRKKIMRRKVLLVIVGIIFLINLPCWDFFTKERYSYCNEDSSFIYTEEWTQNFIACQKSYGCFLSMHPKKDRGNVTPPKNRT